MKRLGLILVTSSVVVFSGLAGCAAQESSHNIASAPDAISEVESIVQAPADTVEADASAGTTLENADDDTSETRAARPQLIRRATLSLDVDSVDQGFSQIRTIVNAQNGDVLEMQDYGDRQRSVSFTLRVPQERLDATLDALAELGEIRGRSIETEDVSDQLVDLQARISNSKKSEAALQEIMSRSGEIADVLEVSRELSNVRQEIETMSALQKKLQTQVRYSTIRLNLQSAIALTSNKPGFSTQIANSWNESTESVGEFTTILLLLGLWLLVYSPYLALLLVGAVFANRIRRRSAQG